MTYNTVWLYSISSRCWDTSPPGRPGYDILDVSFTESFRLQTVNTARSSCIRTTLTEFEIHICSQIINTLNISGFTPKYCQLFQEKEQ